MGKKQGGFGDALDLIFGTGGGHRKNQRKSNHDKHTGARRDTGSGKPNSKSNVRERRRRNGG